MIGLKKTLIDIGKSQKWLAGKMGVSENTISRWINGKYYPSRKKQIELCKLLDKTLDQLNDVT